MSRFGTVGDEYSSTFQEKITRLSSCCYLYCYWWYKVSVFAVISGRTYQSYYVNEITVVYRSVVTIDVTVSVGHVAVYVVVISGSTDALQIRVIR